MKNQITIPVRVLQAAGLHSGDRVVIEHLESGDLLLHREAGDPFTDAFGALTGTYPRGYLENLDLEDEKR